MQKKPYIPAHGMTLGMTNILFVCEAECMEIHVGGICTVKDVLSNTEVKNYLQENSDREIKAYSYSYELLGDSLEMRRATREEMDIIIDEDFPNSVLYSDRLRCVENDDNLKYPKGLKIAFYTDEERCPVMNEIQF